MVRIHDRYKEKECPECAKKHKKEGKFCSQACSNSFRPVTDRQRENGRNQIANYQQTPEGRAHLKHAATNMKAGTLVPQAEDFAIAIPDITDLRDSEFLDDYQRAEDW
jgi:hypothetical protein